MGQRGDPGLCPALGPTNHPPVQSRASGWGVGAGLGGLLASPWAPVLSVLVCTGVVLNSEGTRAW